MDKSFSLLKSTTFNKFSDWNIDRILFLKELLSGYSMASLERILKPRNEKVKPQDIPKERKIVSKIRFSDGKVTLADRKVINNMIRSQKNDLLVSNINFEKGAFAINSFGDLYASTDYTSYVIDEGIVVPDYLEMVLRSNTFLTYVASVKPKGMKTRARYEFIKQFSVPVPSIAVQQRLLDEYHKLIQAAENERQAGDDFGANLLYDVQSKVSNLKKEKVKVKTSDRVLKTTSFTNTNRWEVAYILKDGMIESICSSFKYQAKSISELQTESLFGLSIKASVTQKEGMIPMLRMSNIVNGEIDLNGLKYLPRESAVTAKEPDKWLLRKGDLLVDRTNGSKDLVGKAAVFDIDGEYAYASYLIRYRFDNTVILPEYVNILFMTPIVREQVAVMRRQGGGQYNLNSDEIGAIQIPVPSLAEQQEIIDFFNATKDGAKEYFDKAEELRNKATTDFEKAIFS